MKVFILPLILATTSFAMAGCSTTPKAPAMTPLELQAIQSRSFEEDKSVVFPSVMSVFQDLGYTIEQADIETGFISAKSPTQGTSSSPMLTLLTAALAGSATRTTTTTQTGATAFVEELGGESKVRLNFVVNRGVSGKYGTSRNDKAIVDPLPYQNAFEKIETAVFVRSSL